MSTQDNGESLPIEEKGETAAIDFISKRLERKVTTDFFFKIVHPPNPETGVVAQTEMNEALSKMRTESGNLIRNLKDKNPEAYSLLVNLGKDTEEIESILSNRVSPSGIPYIDLSTFYTDSLLEKSFQYVSEIRKNSRLPENERLSKFREFASSRIVIFDTPLPEKAYPYAVDICTTLGRMMDMPEILPLIQAPTPELSSTV